MCDFVFVLNQSINHIRLLDIKVDKTQLYNRESEK